MMDMIQEKFRTYLKTLLTTPSQFQGLERLWPLCFINLVLIALLGLLMMFMSGRFLFLVLAFTMMMGAGSMIILLLVKLQRLKLTTQKQQIESKAYETSSYPFLI